MENAERKKPEIMYGPTREYEDGTKKVIIYTPVVIDVKYAYRSVFVRLEDVEDYVANYNEKGPESVANRDEYAYLRLYEELQVFSNARRGGPRQESNESPPTPEEIVQIENIIAAGSVERKKILLVNLFVTGILSLLFLIRFNTAFIWATQYASCSCGSVDRAMMLSSDMIAQYHSPSSFS